ncbi:N-acetyltransferase family protein [Melioribacteraceae bacterium 4301-Me]|uniref:GNAT family N-acetyltransferase n=1 Tax=Pyranulibacter aquaticus TaxID=3163344 RepID=UPI0035986A76
MIRKLQYNDREEILDIIKRTENFNEEEKKVAVELIDETLNKSSENYYNTFVYVESDKVLGYYCIGKRPLTDGVYDLYWIVVEPSSRSRGIGKALLSHAEKFVKEKNGRWLLAETSSKESYSSTRTFYLRNKYSIVAEIKDFYTKNDNLIVFGKYIIT